MNLVILYVSTAAIFLALDAIMLSQVMRPLFEAHLGDQLLDRPRIVPAAIFYLGYIGGLVWLASWPALRSGASAQALIGGAVVGAMAYGAYEFTNYATLRAWHPAMVAVDLAWGTVLTGVSAWAGVVVTRGATG